MEIRTRESKMCADVEEQEPVQDAMGAAGHEEMQKTIGVAKQGNIQELSLIHI